MKAMRRLRAVGISAVLAMAVAAAGQQHQHPAGAPEKLGRVRFPISCAAGTPEAFERAVAMLHSFWYEKAAAAFAAIAEKDPACGMAYWGVAMTEYHPLWEMPGQDSLKRGSAAVEAAKSVGAKTRRERDYIAAIEVFYKDWDKLDHTTRALAYEEAMEQLQARYPDDREAAIFYALAVRATAPPSDKTYANQKKAGAILEKIFVEQPAHPGVAHYIIHCYDYPSLAERALDAARRYSKIAADSPHALHMPSHIFTRLGFWQESIDSNLASAAAARKHGGTGDELHALDYLTYAYLQRAQDRQAKKVLDALASPLRRSDPAYLSGLYAMGAIPARYAVERHRWAEAAGLAVPTDLFPGGRYAWAEANIHFARALGAARTGRADAARNGIQRLASLRDTLTQTNEKYWAEQVEIQREIVAAWLALAGGKQEEALRQMRSAADHEDATDKHPVTPGVILPARELLGEMLLQAKQPAQALGEFEAVLRSAQDRFNALSGAARAAELSGNREKAKGFYAKLLAICGHADGDRPELRQAKALLARN